MTEEEIRQKAIEYSKTMIYQRCCQPCKKCDYGDYFLNRDVNCLTISGYEQGFADGVEEGKRLALAEALKPYDVEDVEDLIRNVKNKTIDPFEREIAILNRVDWTEKNLVCFVFRIHEIIEQMKEGGENGRS